MSKVGKTIGSVLLVDVHEPGKIVQRLGARAVIVPLDVGDYQFWSHEGWQVTVERKEIGNLLSSLSSGQLVDQLTRLVKAADIPILLTEGRIGVDEDNKVLVDGHWSSRWNFDSVANFLLSWQMRGVYLIQTHGWRDTAARLLSISEFFAKPEHDSHLQRQRLFSLAPTRNPKLALVRCLPGIDITLGQRLLSTFPTILDICQASVEQLTEVEGIGKEKANRIYAAFRR